MSGVLLLLSLSALLTEAAHITPSSCDACDNLTNTTACTNEAGCYWVSATQECINGCDYATEEECGVEWWQEGCYQQCEWKNRWGCTNKGHHHFDVCVTVDASGTITDSEWANIKEKYVKPAIRSYIPSTCNNFSDPNALETCPHIAIVQFHTEGHTIIPDLTQFGSQYQETSLCLGPEVTMPKIFSGWEAKVDAMQLGMNLNGFSGGMRYTVEGVQRCADLLVNTAKAEPRSSSLLVLLSVGDPNGPTGDGKSGGRFCTACDPNPTKLDAIANRNGVVDVSCQSFATGINFTETNQSIKIRDTHISTALFMLKSDSGYYNTSKTDLTCILTPGSYPIQVTTAQLNLPPPQTLDTSPNGASSSSSSGFNGESFGIGVAVGAAAVGLITLCVGAALFYRNQKVMDESQPGMQRGAASVSLPVSRHGSFRLGDESDEEIELNKVKSVGDGE